MSAPMEVMKWWSQTLISLPGSKVKNWRWVKWRVRDLVKLQFHLYLSKLSDKRDTGWECLSLHKLHSVITLTEAFISWENGAELRGEETLKRGRKNFRLVKLTLLRPQQKVFSNSVLLLICGYFFVVCQLCNSQTRRQMLMINFFFQHHLSK